MASAPAATREPLASPWRATSGQGEHAAGPSLMKVFQTPVTSTARVLRARENPQESSIA